MPSSSKTDLTITVNIWSFSILFKDKLSSELNFISMKSFLYSPASPPFIVLIRYLILSQSSAYFVNTYVLLSVEEKVKYLLPLVSLMQPSALSIMRYKGVTLVIFS